MSRGMSGMVRIVPPPRSGDATGPVLANGTRFYADGVEIKAVRSVVIRIEPDAIVCAELEIDTEVKECWASPVLSEESMKAAAEYWGYDLRKRDAG